MPAEATPSFRSEWLYHPSEDDGVEPVPRQMLILGSSPLFGASKAINGGIDGSWSNDDSVTAVSLTFDLVEFTL